MILVTLGTQDKSFKRLLDAIQKQIDNGNIKDKVVVQAGCTEYDSKDMEIFDLIDRDKFSELIKECDLLITHGGVGSILTGLKNNKKVRFSGIFTETSDPMEIAVTFVALLQLWHDRKISVSQNRQFDEIYIMSGKEG